MRKLVLVALLATACAMPQTAVRTVDTRPAIAISRAPAGARLFVDAKDCGPAAAYDGRPQVLRVEPGTHEVDVRDAEGRTILRQRVFLESETKTLEVH